MVVYGASKPGDKGTAKVTKNTADSKKTTVKSGKSNKEDKDNG